MNDHATRLYKALNGLLLEVLRLPGAAFLSINPDAIDEAHAALSASLDARHTPPVTHPPEPTLPKSLQAENQKL